MSGFEKGEAGFQFKDVNEVLTPVETERYLKLLNNELGFAQLAVRRAREAELTAEHAYMEARTPLLLDEDCPQSDRNTGRVTQKTVDAWFAARIPSPYWALRGATVDRQNAVSYARQVQDQMEIARSLNSNAKTFYATYQGGGR